jgi:uncharacterized protein (TIGR02145 family)
MKTYFFILLFTSVISLHAQNYEIKFWGTGASNNVTQVKIENLTQHTSLIMGGTDILLLKQYITDINDITLGENKKLDIYPNPMSDHTYLNFSLPESGQTFIEIIDISGRSIRMFSEFLNSGINKLILEGLENGIYIVKVFSNNYFISGKLFSISQKNRISSEINLRCITADQPIKKSKGAASNVEMQYNDGDRLKFTGIAGKHKTVVMDTPSSSKTIGFRFISCIDPDGRGYEIVEIGNQWWMAENLAYLPNVSPLGIGSLEVPHYYVVNYNGYSITEAKKNEHYNKYGVLYNWPAIMKGEKGNDNNPSGVKGICPTGWHVPSVKEWIELYTYISDNKGPYSIKIGEYETSGSCSGITKHLKSQKGWENSGWSNPNGTNDYGFSALPGGHRRPDTNLTNVNEIGVWWTTKDDVNNGYYMIYNLTNDLNWRKQGKQYGLSVRCVCDK